MGRFFNDQEGRMARNEERLESGKYRKKQKQKVKRKKERSSIIM
jgi:hypothetical protein